MTLIDAAALRALMAEPGEWVLLDVREAGEADAGQIFGATFLPRRQIETRIGDLVPGRRTPIVVYDEGGPRAELAASTLERLGYRGVRVLRDGTRGWQADGGKLASGSNVPSKLFGEEVYEHDHVPQLPVDTLAQWKKEGRPHFVCDIRTPDEYQVQRIPGAWGAFGVDLARVAGDLRAKDMPIVVHCAGRTRSIIACQTLRALGVNDVHALENGTMGWLLAGFDLEKGPSNGVLQPSHESLADGENRARALGQSAGVRPIAVAELDALLARRATGEANAYLFDVRQLAEYLEGHLEGAVAVPGGLLVQRTDEFAPVRHAPTVLVDDREGRAWLCGYWLARSGRRDVRVLEGGTLGWRAAGRTLVTGRGRSHPLGEDATRDVRRVAPSSLEPADGEARLNVDTSRYFKAGRLPGSRWLPYGDLEPRLAAEAVAKDAPLLLTCHDGRLSATAAANLGRLGYTGVRVLEGGTEAWEKAGRALERGWPAGLPKANDLVVPPYDSSLESMRRYLEWEQKLTAERRSGNAG